MITHEPGDIIDFYTGEIYGENSFYADVAIWIRQQLQSHGNNFILLDKKDLDILHYNDMAPEKTFWVSMHKDTRHHIYKHSYLTRKEMNFVDNILLERESSDFFSSSTAYTKLFDYFSKGHMVNVLHEYRCDGKSDMWILNRIRKGG